MIKSFGNQLAKDLFAEERTRETKRFPTELYQIANRKLQYLNAAAMLKDLRVPPGNRLEQLRGRLAQFDVLVSDP